jgi:hypothetical protein
MTEQSLTLTRHDLEAKIVKRCWENEDFRREFTADPVATAVRYLEIPTASLPKIVIHEEPAGSWHIVLPPRPVNADALLDEDLEQIAGGSALINAFLRETIFASVAAASAIASGSIAASAIVTDNNKGW